MAKKADVAVYYFPGYHPDERNEAIHGKGWDEWALTKRATPRYEGHEQPKIPMWGYLDESKPEVSELQINAAADHGVDAFIFDWYWYDNKPFLESALEKGYLKAGNNSRLKFSLMWANHNWNNIFPYKRGSDFTQIFEGSVPRDHFEDATDYIIGNYMSHPSYWRVDGGLYFSFYELMSLVHGLGGMDETREALAHFRDKVRAAGLGELHLNAVVWGIQNLPGAKTMANPNEMVKLLGFDSVTSYVWIHNVPMETYPTVAYPEYAVKAYGDWDKYAREFDLPYSPNVSMGWDSSPRTVQSDVHGDLGYPFTPILVGNTPGEFKKSLQTVKSFMESGKTEASYITINAWNEWTEGSYLEPDTVNGMGYLEAIRDVFGK